MKKSIFWAAAGLMALAACQQQQAGFTIQGYGGRCCRR